MPHIYPFKVKRALNLDPQGGTVAGFQGDIAFRSDILKIEMYNGTGIELLCTDTNTLTLTNKTLTNAIVGTQSAGDNSTKAASTAYVDTAVAAGGTVKSVAMTVPAFLSISGSPVTTTGTLALTLSGTALPIANGGTGQTTKTAAFDALQPMTTGGDLIYGGASGTATRLANGASGQVLTSGGGTAAPTWSPVTVAPVAINAQTANYTLTTTDSTVTFTGSHNATLPTAVGNSGLTFTIKNSGTGTTTILTTSAQTIDGRASGAITLPTQYETLQVESDGANWTILNHTWNTAWQSFTMSITGSGSNPTKATTTLYDQAVWRRNGPDMEILYNYGHSNNAGTVLGSGTYLFTLPVSAAADTSAITANTTNATGVVGKASASATGVGSGHAKMYDATHIAIFLEDAPDAIGSFVGSTFLGLTAADIRYSFRASVPISGWNW